MITGGTGLFGRWLLIFFSYLNYKYNYQIQIFVIIRKTNKNLNFLKKLENLFNVNIVALTIENYKFFKFKKKIDYFFHFASFSKDTKNWYEEHFHFSIIELKNLLNFFSKKINYFIFSSSGQRWQPGQFPRAQGSPRLHRVESRAARPHAGAG